MTYHAETFWLVDEHQLSNLSLHCGTMTTFSAVDCFNWLAVKTGSVNNISVISFLPLFHRAWKNSNPIECSFGGIP